MKLMDAWDSIYERYGDVPANAKDESIFEEEYSDSDEETEDEEIETNS